MQPCGLNECTDKRVEYGGTLVRKSGGWTTTRAPLQGACFTRTFMYSPYSFKFEPPDSKMAAVAAPGLKNFAAFGSVVALSSSSEVYPCVASNVLDRNNQVVFCAFMPCD